VEKGLNETMQREMILILYESSRIYLTHLNMAKKMIYRYHTIQCKVLHPKQKLESHIRCFMSTRNSLTTSRSMETSIILSMEI
jgi:hypothetical protein